MRQGDVRLTAGAVVAARDPMRALVRQSMLAVAAMTTVHATVAEFVEIQALSPPALRERFDLPDSCEPTVAAMRARFEQVTVLISCDDADDGDRGASS